MHFFKKRAVGVHPNSHKECSGTPIRVLEQVPFVRIPMQMQIGPGCKPCVAKGDSVQVGQIIGEPLAPMSVPIHASVSGTVSAVLNELNSSGQKTMSIEIQNDKKFTLHESVVAPHVDSKESFIQAVRASGLVGLGGAGFPAHFKLNPPPGKKIDLLILNGMECEPYITVDDWLCAAHADDIVHGAELVMSWCEIPECIIGTEDNTPEAFSALQKAVAASPLKDRMNVVQLEATYPQGAEKVLIRNLTGREVPSGALPHDVGCLVMNVGSARYISYYLETGIPLTRRFITLAGSAINNPGNYDVPIGAPIRDLIELAGGFKAVPDKIIMGGPMMGLAVHSEDSSILKNNNAILALSPEEARIPDESPCIHCARCIRACPMNLIPCLIDQATRNHNLQKLYDLSSMDCIECGCCTYTCPAKRYLVQNIKVGKIYLRADMMAKKAAAEAKAKADAEAQAEAEAAALAQAVAEGSKAQNGPTSPLAQPDANGKD